ncbi:uridine kinase [Clostridium acetobutylicum]|uniref:Fision threonyl-tRNA synthetase (N-terminal part) and uridine kinase n=1 Tax=Clostridium acetobutylicum (strain ATCC 824 / DSM 792 / JCM 1419 / IAM 19013 / LMG 5710 / NBRC 13948 / NRRL B-527 / VKM B-1787 / 2291 / W) TaxID=272562 RepID=Q97L90_CLOAB|nr:MULTISPECIES: nucleoside kinase [Clostridium]AAK78649.1 Fision threonyl-tRNA synthetase (N-terminal part) and uridine kinase [Clostridium acetobutylicum ATCC 824]ADZ19723.1 Fision threonyl-tRNA synthetase (N-terminal part) and uridine kinase [Clostridium acetobutylicum EA 2018]AEI31373.1 Fision threonyl-tRNA synthetase and uridine kinase [Clostridium acetobutylicum DSM 1731]AWV80370.1 nucleoside kinase [Clostridium acetobutylicum]MBC2392558.1 nucleoside kinase [Clostridium acetobutylicum]
MSSIEIKLKDGRSFKVNRGTSFHDFINQNKLEGAETAMLGSVNGNIYELTHKFSYSGIFDIIDLKNPIGIKVYERTLQFVLVKAVSDILPNAVVTIEHSINNGIFGEIHKQDGELTEADIDKIKNRMLEIVKKDLPIKKVTIDKEKAVEIFEKYGMKDKVRLLKYVKVKYLKLYELDGRYDYFYGAMAYSTGALKLFDLNYYKPGFILRIPLEKDVDKIPEYRNQTKLYNIFYETEQWGNILGVGDVGSLNDKVMKNEIKDIVLISEALHEKKIAYIADMISERKDIKLVLIAGPSSSGKTTFSKRLGVQLRVNGLMPVAISLDDYFVDRDKTPKDENGNYDFESIEALDVELFNKNLKDLMEYKETALPKFDFRTGKRIIGTEKIKMPQNGVLIVEGIHGLNEKLTLYIDKKNKFKIYVSALTQLNLDDHNRISTTDVRKIRRIVRDYLSRGYGGEETLKMWPSIKRGEEKNIFVFQEEADVMFNSTLVYELGILRKYALLELSKIKPSSSVYYEARKLRNFLNFFKDIDEKLVPQNSILKEFIGGSCFYDY